MCGVPPLLSLARQSTGNMQVGTRDVAWTSRVKEGGVHLADEYFFKISIFQKVRVVNTFWLFGLAFWLF